MFSLSLGNAASPYVPSTPGGQPMTPSSNSYLPGTPGGQPMTPGNVGLDVMSPAIGQMQIYFSYCSCKFFLGKRELLYLNHITKYSFMMTLFNFRPLCSCMCHFTSRVILVIQYCKCS